MDPATSKAKRSTSEETKTAVVPRIPQDVVDEILDHLAADEGVTSLRLCSLVSKSWVPSCRRHLFHDVRFISGDMVRWLKRFPVPGESPAPHVRNLRFYIQAARDDYALEEFSECTQWFPNVERVSLLGTRFRLRSRRPPSWRLSPSVTSLTIDTGMVTLVQVGDSMAHPPNLDDLSLSGFPDLMVKDQLSGIGTALRGRFGGQSFLCWGYVHKGVVNMLLEIPTGLHFTEVKIETSLQVPPIPIVWLVEVCGNTLVKLEYALTSHHAWEPFKRSFDFSKFPSLQEVEFKVYWMGGGLTWIPMALSTLKPATSPYLSTIKLHLQTITASRSALRDTGNDLRWIADKVDRIEREFGGAVDFTLRLDPEFEAVLDLLNTLQC